MTENVLNLNSRIGQIRQVEARIKEIEKRHKEELAPYEKLADQMRNTVLSFLNITNQENTRTKNGTAYKLETISYRLEDPDEFKRHVIGTESWDAINWSANKTHADAVFAKDKILLPGVTRNVTVSVRVLAPAKPKVKKIAQPETELTQEEWAEIDASLGQPDPEQEQQQAAE